MKKSIILLIVCTLLSCTKQLEQLPSDLVGVWQLVEIQQETGSIMASEHPEQVIIDFNKRAFTGDTGRNEFFGSYQISGNSSLIIKNFATSEAGESELGNAFYDALMTGYNNIRNLHQLEYSVTNLLYLSSGTERLIFKRISTQM